MSDPRLNEGKRNLYDSLPPEPKGGDQSPGEGELIARLRADRLPECSFDDGKTWELDGVVVAETFAAAASEIERLTERVARMEEERAELRARVAELEAARDLLMREMPNYLTADEGPVADGNNIAVRSLIRVAEISFAPSARLSRKDPKEGA